MADRQVRITYKIDDAGSIRVLRQIEDGVRDVGTASTTTGAAMSRGFNDARTAAIAAAAAVAGVGAAAVRVAGEVQRSLDTIDQIGETANAVGQTAEQLSSLRLAAQQGGASLDTVGRAVQFFNRELVKAREGGGKAALLEALGVRDLERDALPVLLDVADALGQVQDGAVRSTAGQALFGRQFLAVANVITPALREQITLNAKLGGTLSNEVVAAAGQAADSLDAIKFAAATLSEEIAVALLPDINAATSSTLEWVSANRELVSSGLVGYLRDARDAIGGLQAIGDLPVLRQLRELNLYLAGGAIESVAALGRSDWETGTGRIPPGDINQAVRGVAQRLATEGAGDDRARRIRATLGGTDRATSSAAAHETARATQDARREASELLDVWTAIDLRVEQTAGRVYDLTAAVGDVPTRVIEGLLGRDGGFDIGDVIEGSGQAIATEFASGLIAAQLEKEKFDLAVSENFSVTLPGFMRDGADQITAIFSDAMATITGDAAQASSDVAGAFGRSYAQVGSGASNTANVLAGLARAGYTSGDFQVSGTGGAYLVQDPYGTRFGGSDLDAVLGAAGGVGGGGGGQAAGASFGAVAATALPLIGLGIAAISGGIAGRQQALDSIGLRKTVTDDDLRQGADFTGGLFEPVTRGKGRTPDAGSNILDVVFTGGIGTVLRLAGAFQPPTQGSQRKEALSDAINRANLPQQSVLANGEQGVRSKFLEVLPDAATAERFAAAGFGSNIPGLRQPTLDDFRPGPIQETITGAAAANPEVDAFRTREALAFGVLSTGQLRGGSLVANSLTSNLLLQGVSEREARRQTRKLAEQAGIGLDTGVEEAQRLYTEGVFKDDPLTAVNEKTQQLVTTITGLVGIFEDDIPAGVDVAALAMGAFTEGVGVDVAEFNDELKDALLLFGQLRDTSRAGLRGGIGGSLDKFADARSTYDRQGPVDQIIRLRLEGEAELVSQIQGALYGGASTALEQALYDEMVESDAWKSVEQQIAEVIATGDLAGLPESIADAVDAFLPAITATSEAAAALKEALGTTPAALLAAGESLQERLDDAKFGDLSPKQQEAQLRADLADQRAQIDDILEGGVTAGERGALAELLQEYGDTGLQLADMAEGYAPGSTKYREGKQAGYDATQLAADLFEQFGLDLADAAKSGTSDALVLALEKNTQATEQNTAAQGGGATAVPANVTLNMQGGGGGGWDTRLQLLKDVLEAVRHDPRWRQSVRDAARAR